MTARERSLELVGESSPLYEAAVGALDAHADEAVAARDKVWSEAVTEVLAGECMTQVGWDILSEVARRTKPAQERS